MDELRKLMDRGKFWDNLNDEFEMGATDAIEAVNNALDNTPTVDAVPVTRCKDCEYWEASKSDPELHYCTLIDPWDSPEGVAFPEDFFCAFGKPLPKEENLMRNHNTCNSEKTADEMFRDLGYEPVKEDSNYPMYQNKIGIAIEIAVPQSIAKWARDPWKTGCFPFTAEEIKACAQLIREVEEKQNDE